MVGQFSTPINRITQTQAEVDQKYRDQTAELTKEQQTRAKEIREVREKMEATETGGLHISAMGAVWLFLGVIMSTAAAELIKWLK